MYLLGVIIVIMFQHKVHVNQKHIWNQSFILDDHDQSKLHIIVFYSVVEKNFDLPVSNTAQNAIVCKLNNKTFLFTIDRFNKCIEFVDN